MSGRTIFRVLLVVVVVAIAIGTGVAVYNAGVAQGITQGMVVAGGQPSAVAPYPYPYYGPYFHPWGFGFGFLWFLFPLFFCFLIFGLLRAAFWGPRRGWRGPHGDDERVPRRFEEWHRQLHEPPSEQNTTQA